jgi:hypothetical protein
MTERGRLHYAAQPLSILLVQQLVCGLLLPVALCPPRRTEKGQHSARHVDIKDGTMVSADAWSHTVHCQHR